MPNFSIQKFDTWLQINNYYFAYTLHPNSSMVNSIPYDTERIKFINTSNLNLFDINEFMLEVDVLINDYSTTSTDFSILNKPQLFYMPDYNKYRNIKGFLSEFRTEMPGREIVNYDDLIDSLSYINSNKNGYLSDYHNKIMNILTKYYSLENTLSSEKYYDFIKI